MVFYMGVCLISPCCDLRSVQDCWTCCQILRWAASFNCTVRKTWNSALAVGWSPWWWWWWWWCRWRWSFSIDFHRLSIVFHRFSSIFDCFQWIPIDIHRFPSISIFSINFLGTPTYFYRAAAWSPYAGFELLNKWRRSGAMLPWVRRPCKGDGLSDAWSWVFPFAGMPQVPVWPVVLHSYMRASNCHFQICLSQCKKSYELVHKQGRRKPKVCLMPVHMAGDIKYYLIIQRGNMPFFLNFIF